MSFDSIAAALASGARTSVGLVETALEGAAAAPHVFISLRTEEALREAAEADRRRGAGQALGPLDGIPIGWKDLIDIAGMRTTAGSPARAGVEPALTDAPVVAATRMAGLIPLGKTNLNEFAFSGIGLNEAFGTPFAQRPGGDSRAPGGSSAGSAIAVERGVVVAAVGSDTAGSVRVPAAFNGLVGFRASRARYPMQGVFPLARSFDGLGPIARSVRDCAWLDAAMRGLSVLSTAARRPVRVIADSATLEDPELTEVVRANTVSFIGQLREAGLTVDIAPVEALSRARNALAELGWLGAYEAYEQHRELLSSAQRDEVDFRVVRRLEAAASFPPEHAAKLRTLRPLLVDALAQELGGALLLQPTVKHVAPLLAPLTADFELFARVNMATLAITMPGSYLDAPGIALPSGTDADGHPTSVLLQCASGEDDRLLGEALWIERHLSEVSSAKA